MSIESISTKNLEALKGNPYPGRGIITGLSPDGKNFIQVYWIMGRSENSRNRIFVNDSGTVKTKAYDESKVKDPSLIIYNSNRNLGNCHIVSNGDQTDTIFNEMKSGKGFDVSLDTRTFEPDEPNYTPRISGIVNLDDSKYAYQLSILKAMNNNPDYCSKQFFNYEKGIAGIGHCIQTYVTDGNPLPPFEGEPYLLPLFNDIEETAAKYWETLNEDNKISLAVKYVNIETKEYNYKIINKHSA